MLVRLLVSHDDVVLQVHFGFSLQYLSWVLHNANFFLITCKLQPIELQCSEFLQN